MPFLAPGSASYDASLAVLGPGLAEGVFQPFAAKRQPRTAMLVQGARAQGERRVAVGEKACRERDADIQRMFATSDAIAQKFEAILKEPFDTIP